MWPFKRKLEKRNSWADAVARLEHILAERPFQDASATASAELTAGLLERSMLMARVSGTTEMMADSVARILPLASREIILTGESLFWITVDELGLHLLPAMSYHVWGNEPQEQLWKYELHLSCPTNTRSVYNVPSSDCLHFRYGARAQQPYQGKSAWTAAKVTGVGSARAETSLSVTSWIPLLEISFRPPCNRIQIAMITRRLSKPYGN